MKPITYTLIALQLLLNSCQDRYQSKNTHMPIGTHQVVGGGCDGCELMYAGMPKQLSSTSISPAWKGPGQRLVITGTVWQADGKTPAAGVILYYWQTDAKGLYSPGPQMDPKAVRHGHIRGWVKTDLAGHYRIKTIRPAPYPHADIPAHIHLVVKEPALSPEYYPDDINFDDDPLLLPYLKKYPQQNRCGSGIVRLLQRNGLQLGQHDLILGLNIPNYPKTPSETLPSGLAVGLDQPSFIPFHAYGPDKGTQTCPVCRYGRHHGILYFVGKRPDWADISKWLRYLENAAQKSKGLLKVYLVYGNPEGYSQQRRQHELERLGQSLQLRQLALTYVPSFEDQATEAYLNQINPEAANTFVVYRQRRIIAKYTNLEPTNENFRLLSALLQQSRELYPDWPERTGG